MIRASRTKQMGPWLRVVYRGAASLALTVGALGVLAGQAVAAPPANDDFAAATSLTGTMIDLPGETNAGATGQPGEPNHLYSSIRADCGDPVTRNDGTPDPTCEPSVWYAWTAPRTLIVTIDTCGTSTVPGSSVDSTLAVYTGDAVDALTPVAGNNDAGDSSGFCSATASRVTFRAVAGTRYEIAVAGVQGTTGTFAFHLFEQPPPANDDFASATALSGDSVSLSAQINTGATGQSGEPDHAGSSLAADCSAPTVPDRTCLPSVWYAWTASRTFIVTIDTCDPVASYDTTLAVYTGSSVGGLSEVASNDNSAIRQASPSCDPIDSRVTFRAIAGTTYRIAVAGSVGSMGSFSLHLFQQPRPANDDFAAATALKGSVVDLGGQSTLAATGEPGEPNHAGVSLGAGCSNATSPGAYCLPSVWYAWSSPDPAVVSIDLCDPTTTIDTTLAIYTGSTVDALSEVASNDDAMPVCARHDGSAFASRVSFQAAAGAVYRIAVANSARQGPFALHLRSTPVPPLAAGSPPEAVGPAPSGAGADVTAPVLSALGMTNNPFVVGARPTGLFGFAAVLRHKRGTTLRYRLSEAARVRIAITRRRSGRRRHGRCVAPTRVLRHAQRCVRITRAGALTRTSKRGLNRVAFSGRVGSRALRPGRYRARLTATDAAKNSSKPKIINFTIARL